MHKLATTLCACFGDEGEIETPKDIPHRNITTSNRFILTDCSETSVDIDKHNKTDISDLEICTNNLTEHNQTNTNLAPPHYKDILFNRNQEGYNKSNHNYTNNNLIEVMTETVPSTSIIRSSSKIFDEDYIYKYLADEINEAKSYNDLYKLIHHLLPINKLKEILSNRLLESKNRRKQQTDTNRSMLQEIYLNAASLEEIFSDDMLVNIIGFLPSSQYQSLPCISRNFQNIMKKYPSIYKQYTINISLDHSLLNNDGVLWLVINHNTTNIRIIHQLKNVVPFMRNDSLSIRRQFEEDAILNDPKSIKYELKTLEDITEKVPFLWYCCKKWNISSIKKIKRRGYLSTTSSAHAPPMIAYKSGGSTQYLGDYIHTKFRSRSSHNANNNGNNINSNDDHEDTNCNLTQSPTTKYEITIDETPTTEPMMLQTSTSSMGLMLPGTPTFIADNSNTHSFNINNVNNSNNGVDVSSSTFAETQNDENNLFVAILNKSSNYVESLCVDGVNDKDGAKWSLLLNTPKLFTTLNHLCINQVIHSSILESWLSAKQQLRAIRYLRLNQFNINQMNLDTLKQLIESLQDLMVFDCYMNYHHQSALSNDNNDNSNNHEDDVMIIKFPSNIQFIRLQFVGSLFKIDLSECQCLCGLYLNDMIQEKDTPSLNPILSQNENDPDENPLNHNKKKTVYDHIIWPSFDRKIECLLLDSTMDDEHNMNQTLPTYINEWYSSLKLTNNLLSTVIPVRFVRFITHPFMIANKPNMIVKRMSSAEDIDDDDIPEPPTLIQATPIRVSATPPVTFVSNRYDDYQDPLKLEKDNMQFIGLDDLQQCVYQKHQKQRQQQNEHIQILDDEQEHLYKGCLWELLLKLKYKERDKDGKDEKYNLQSTKLIYQNWFDLGLGLWIRDLGADNHKLFNFSNPNLRFLHPYSVSYRNTRPAAW